jgi:hypothetical protein
MAIGPRARDGDGGNHPAGLWPAPQRHGLPIFPTGGAGCPRRSHRLRGAIVGDAEDSHPHGAGDLLDSGWMV